jgi:hypothetical protein
MKQDEMQQLESSLKGLSSNLTLSFYAKKNDDFSNKLKDFVETVSEASGGKIELKVGDGEGEGLLPGTPAFTLSAREKSNVAYLAIPDGPELPPFLEALRSLSGNPPPLATDTQEALDKVAEPAKVRVLISAFCPNCPKVVQEVLTLASSNPMVSAAIVDIEPFSQMAEEYNVKSVPATIIDGELVLIGQQSAKRLAELMALRGTEEFDGECIRSLVETGRVSEAAKHICDGRGRKAILKIFQEPELSTRMGVLMVLEEALEMDRNAVQEMVPSLVELLSHEDSRIRGDIADLLGKVGDPRAIPHLEQLANDPDPDVVEAASDALEELE